MTQKNKTCDNCKEASRIMMVITISKTPGEIDKRSLSSVYYICNKNGRVYEYMHKCGDD